METINLHYYQYDFLEIRVKKVDQAQIQWQNFEPHPNLSRHYILKENRQFHRDRFDLFMRSDGSLKIRSSVPYLVYGHNYVEVCEKELSQVMKVLSKIVGVDLFEAEVLQMEYGAYEKIIEGCKAYISKVIGVKNYDIEKSDTNMRMFGNGKGLHYKLYDAVKNAKSKKTYTRGNYPTGKLIKHELKFTDVQKVFKQGLTVYDLCLPVMRDTLTHMLHQYRGQICFQNRLIIRPIGNTLSDILYAGLKQLEQEYGQSASKLITRIINDTKLSPSQKSKRRKSLMDLETAYNQKF